MCQRKFRPIKYMRRYSYAKFGTFFRATRFVWFCLETRNTTVPKYTKKFHIHGWFTCRKDNSVRCRTFSITCDLHIKLVFCSWLQSWHSMCSSLTGVANWGPCRACGFVIHDCGIDNLCLRVRPWHRHTCLLDVGDVYHWGNFRIYAHHISQVLWLFPIQSHVVALEHVKFTF